MLVGLQNVLRHSQLSAQNHGAGFPGGWGTQGNVTKCLSAGATAGNGLKAKVKGRVSVSPEDPGCWRDVTSL